jgi:ABC-type polysaccharide/polyol phosphate transport system ATPase subunit
LSLTVANAVSPSTGAPGSGRTAIVVDRVSKSFQIPHQQYSTLKERALHPLRPNTFDVFDALKDVSFSVGKGEFFGIVGRNGSGKASTASTTARSASRAASPRSSSSASGSTPT